MTEQSVDQETNKQTQTHLINALGELVDLKWPCVMFKYTNGRPIWVTLAESSNANIDLRYLSIVIGMVMHID